MPTDRRRAAARRRAWGRGRMILRFEPLEARNLLSTGGNAAATPLPDLVGSAFDTLHNLDWGDTFHARGAVLNQGAAPVATPFHVDFYASPTPGLSSSTAVLLGQATVPAGLQPGQSAPIDQVLSLPIVPLSGVGADNAIYVDMVVDPDNTVAESNKQNNYGLGQGYDLSLVTITPHQPADLVGASLGVYPDQASWGTTLKVAAQVQNNGPGDAPATRARVVLTPTGSTPGGPADVTVGSLSVPAIAANQTDLVTGSVTLPAAPPASLAGVSQFVLSVVQDADFVTNPVVPHTASRGIGFDRVNLTLAPPSDPNAALGPKPDLTPATVQAPSQPIAFGQTFQVTTSIQNKGNLDAGPYRVRFLLVGTNGDLTQGLFLGDTTLQGLKAGYGQDVVQTLKFPSRLPDGVAVSSQARIAVEVDPENTIDEANKANNAAVSGVVNLTVVAADGTTTPATTATQAATTAKTTVANTTAAKAPATAARTTTPTLKPTGTAPTPTPTPTPTQPQVARKRTVKPAHHTFQHNLKVFPKRVSHYVHKIFK